MHKFYIDLFFLPREIVCVSEASFFEYLLSLVQYAELCDVCFYFLVDLTAIPYIVPRTVQLTRLGEYIKNDVDHYILSLDSLRNKELPTPVHNCQHVCSPRTDCILPTSSGVFFNDFVRLSVGLVQASTKK